MSIIASESMLSPYPTTAQNIVHVSVPSIEEQRRSVIVFSNLTRIFSGYFNPVETIFHQFFYFFSGVTYQYLCISQNQIKTEIYQSAVLQSQRAVMLCHQSVLHCRLLPLIAACGEIVQYFYVIAQSSILTSPPLCVKEYDRRVLKTIAYHRMLWNTIKDYRILSNAIQGNLKISKAIQNSKQRQVLRSNTL